ncbi:MAG: hypothetical protein RL259_844 [Bacteroidota bacterium]|jgi:hypothetical protein
MKKIITSFICISILISCTSTTEEAAVDLNEIGTWRLIEVYADPGDGSGSFQPVVSSKTVTFEANGNVNCNGNLCDLSITATTQTRGTYSSSTNRIMTSNCNQLQLDYEITEDVLIINYPFIETCKAKYIKVQ